MDYSKPHTIFVVDTNVQVWFHSPSGDSSDSQIFDIHCGSREQAMVVAQQWAQRFELPWYDPEFRNAWDTNGLSSHGQWTVSAGDF
jgi:hypothetical protein